MNFEDIKDIFHTHGFDIRFITPRDIIIYDDDPVIIRNIELRGRTLLIYINLDNEYA